MTTYAPNWTPRYKAHYKVVGLVHSVTLRTARGSDVAATTALATVAHDLFAAFATSLGNDFEWTAAEYALTDSDVFVPTATPSAVTGLVSASSFTIQEKITPLIITGRSATGRARVSVYGLAIVTGEGAGAGNNYIITEAEAPALTDALTALQDNALGNAGEVTVWHRTATMKPNDRLVKRVRQGIIS